MKKHLLAAVSSAALLFASGAYADGGPIPEETPPPPDPVMEEPAGEPAYQPAEPEYNWYTTIFAGAAFGDDLEVDISGGGPTFDVPVKTGYLLGWTLGYDNMFNGNMLQFRPEVELSFRQQDTDLEDIFGVNVDPFNLSNNVLSLMGNLWLDLALSPTFDIYAGGGIGYGWADFSLIETNDLVWQFGGGFNVDGVFGSNTFVGIGYRYFGGNFEEDTDFFGPPVTIEVDYRTHEVMANLGVRF